MTDQETFSVNRLFHLRGHVPPPTLTHSSATLLETFLKSSSSDAHVSFHA
jgi:hypothetical protein